MRIEQALALLALFAGCAETGQDHARIPLFVAGTEQAQPVTAVGDIPVTIDRADLAFGPLYLCAGATAGDLCDTARLEWLDSIVVDTKRSAPTLAGELTGVTGEVRSWMYDLGLSSQLTRKEPFVLRAASDLGGASLVLEGRAVVDGIYLRFATSVPIQQTDDTELGVPVIRKSTSEAFSRDVGSNESGLVVRFDPAAWVRGIDFRSYFTRESCGADRTLVCDGTIERTCDGGVEVSTRDCSELGSICLPALGCAAQLTIDSKSEGYRSLRNALTSSARPTFQWDYVP